MGTTKMKQDKKTEEEAENCLSENMEGHRLTRLLSTDLAQCIIVRTHADVSRTQPAPAGYLEGLAISNRKVND